MKYVNAKDILPEDILKQLQTYAAGTLLYVPKEGEEKSWGMRVAENGTLFRYLDVLREKYPGIRVVGSTAHRQQTVYEAMLTGPLVLMIGNETNGLCQAFKAHCDELLTIPMNEGSCATSFNVSCAASVIMYEVMRQRREKG